MYVNVTLPCARCVVRLCRPWERQSEKSSVRRHIRYYPSSHSVTLHVIRSTISDRGYFALSSTCLHSFSMRDLCKENMVSWNERIPRTYVVKFSGIKRGSRTFMPVTRCVNSRIVQWQWLHFLMSFK